MTAEILLSILLGLGAILALVAGWLFWRRPLMQAQADLMQLRESLAQTSTELEAARRQADDRDALRQQTSELQAELAAARSAAAERDRAHADALAERSRVQAELLAEREEQTQRQLKAMQAEFERLASAALEQAQKRFTDSADETLKLHRAEAARGLDSNREALAKLVNPMQETLSRYGEQLQLLETKREQAYGSLSQQLRSVATGQEAVRNEAEKLVSALRSSARASGAWGEAQLRNVLEMAGLREDIDFTLQTSTTAEGGNLLRPDAVLRLPGGRELIIDSKCSLADYLAASEAETEDARKAALGRHALSVRNHAKRLQDKSYWKEFAQSADFVIMFLPGENFLSAALEQDLDLLRQALDWRILLAGPTNLLAIARIVSMVWRQEKMAEEARAIGALGAELHNRLATMTEHVARVGHNLQQAGSAYDDFIGSLERRVLATARKFPQMGIDPGKKPIPDLQSVARPLRQISDESNRPGA